MPRFAGHFHLPDEPSPLERNQANENARHEVPELGWRFRPPKKRVHRPKGDNSG